MDLTNEQLYDVFAEWNSGELDSYLIEITRDIFSVKDPETGEYLVDMILDAAGAKGTGKWMSQLALDLGVPSTLVTEAVYARSLSALKEERERASKVLRGPAGRYEGDREAVHRSRAAGAVRLEDLQLRPGFRATASGSERTRVAAWISATSPCCGAAAASFARASWSASKKRSMPTKISKTCCWRRTSARRWKKRRRLAARRGHRPCELGIRTPAFMTALSYYDGIRQDRLPVNLLQAQRDYFGAHTYQRIDKPGTFHSEWLELRRQPK